MDALGYDFNALSLEEGEQKKYDLPPQYDVVIKIAFIGGIFYLIAAMVEGAIDLSPVLNRFGSGATFSPWYAVVKVVVIGTYVVFMYGYYKIGQAYRNLLVMVSSLLLILGTAFTLSADIYASYTQNVDFLTVQVVKSVILGALYVVFGVGLLKYQAYFGSLALITAILGMISGVAFLSVFLALPGLAVFTVFEILQLVLLYRVFTANRERKNMASGDIPAFS